MALRFIEGWDHYTTLAQKWTSANASTSVAAAALRTGIAGLRMTASGGGVALTIDAQGTWVIGAGFRISAIAAGRMHWTKDAGTLQGYLQLNADGTLSVRLGDNTVLATSSRSLMPNVFYYIELKHIILNAGGTLEVRVDGAVWATFAGDTQRTANPTANSVGFHDAAGPGGNVDYDDVYVLDGTGAINNNYLGNKQVQCILPSGVGAYTEWLTLFGAASHWQANNEVPPNDDTSYVADLVLNSRDTYAYGNITPAAATIPGIQTLMRAKQVLAGVANIARLYRNGGADYQGADTLLTVNYAYLREVIELDPAAGPGAWAVAAVNSAEFGARVR